MKIVYPRLAGPGWAPITSMARLAAKVFDAQLHEYSASSITNRLHSAAGRIPRRRGREQHCLIIAAHPAYLLAALNADHWIPGFQHVSAWVIDSFWTERIPPAAFRGRHIDQLFVTDAELAEEWERSTGVPTAWASIGSDVLDRGSCRPDRPVDLQRLGRQPTDWDDDAVNDAECTRAGLVYRGRPPLRSDPDSNQSTVADALTSAKFSLSFSNKVNPAAYTHPTREYLTPRWADSLAAGATVAGIRPQSQTATTLLWPEATLEFADTTRGANIEALVQAVDAWTPDRARLNYARALRRLDWRWQLDEIARVIGHDCRTLPLEMDRLRTASAEAEQNAAIGGRE